jgi:D-alanine-D-alanine ligase
VGKLKLNLKTPKITAISESGKTYLISLKNGGRIAQIDVFFPIIHGSFGEDGCLQGFFELLGAAYVGPGVLGSSVGMDKDIMKRVFIQSGISTAKFITLSRNDKYNLKSIFKELRKPVFVKPANLGSSVGISKAQNITELKKAIELAFQFDNKIIVEEMIIGREIECSVLGNEKPIASHPGEIKLKPGYFYSYNAKYIEEDTAIPNPKADLSKKDIKLIQETAIKVFQSLCCEGMGRVDFFLTSSGKVYANEINTLPGFTSISMYPKMFEESGIPYQKLLDKLIKLAMDRKRRNDKLKREY